jgi:hypothetical protein
MEDIRGGVGTPYLIQDVKRDRVWLLFTGWKDPVGLKREGLVAEVDEDLNVSLRTARKILPSEFPTKVDYTHNAVRGIYNEARDEFLVTSTHGSKVLLFVFDPHWNLKGHREILDFGRVADPGFPMKPTGAYGVLTEALASTPLVKERGSPGVGLYLVKNVDDLSKVEVEDWGEFGRWANANDVIDLTTLPRIQVFVEEDNAGKWGLQTFLGPTVEEVPQLNSLKEVEALQASLMPLLPIDDSLTQVGHPHYTILPDGRPKLLFASFRDTWTRNPSTNREGYTHEIWAAEVSLQVFDPRAYPERRGLFNGRQSKWFYASGVSKLLVNISGPAKLRMRLSLEDQEVEEQELRKGLNVVQSPGTWVQISSQAEVKATIVAR